MENSSEIANTTEGSSVESILLKITNLEATVHKYEAFCQQLVFSNRNLNNKVKKLNDENDEILIEAELLRSN